MAILSIQSHVVYGYAGNTAAVFPLQRLGREVWAINTVEFSNHTGYNSWKGKVLGAELVSELVTGLEERGALSACEAVLSGYLGDGAVGKAIIDTEKKKKKENPSMLYVCDPVMGDKERGIYVKPDIPEIFKNEILPHADIACPNHFELETLTGITVNNINDAEKAIDILHKMGPSIVLVTSFKEAMQKDKLSMLASDGNELLQITTPELPLGSGIAGTGDMTSAVFLSRYLETRNLEKTLEMCTASVFGILEASFAGTNSAFDKKRIILELKLIESQDQFVAPSHFFKSENKKRKEK